MTEQKQGNSAVIDRINLISQFIKTFGKDRIEVVLGDREFIGQEWVDWLKNERIPYNLRIREIREYVADSNGEMVHAYKLFQRLRPGKTRMLGLRRIGLSRPFYTNVSGLCGKNGTVVALMHSADIHNPCETYRKRWEIEVLFKAFKTGGFNLESTHIVEPERLNTLLGILALACCIAYRCGIMLINLTKPVLKKHGYKALSVIRYGLDVLLNFIQIKTHKPRGKLKKIMSRFKRRLMSYFRGLRTFVM